jgi:hypothetical protein
MVVISSALSVGPINDTLDDRGQPVGPPGKSLEKSFPTFAEDLTWWAIAAKARRAIAPPPY